MQTGMDCGVGNPCKMAWTDQCVNKQGKPHVPLTSHRRSHACAHPTRCTSHTSHRSSHTAWESHRVPQALCSIPQHCGTWCTQGLMGSHRVSHTPCGTIPQQLWDPIDAVGRRCRCRSVCVITAGSPAVVRVPGLRCPQGFLGVGKATKGQNSNIKMLADARR